MYFQALDDYKDMPRDQFAIGAGQSPVKVVIPIDRTFPIDSIEIEVTGNITAAAARMNCEGLPKILNQITLDVKDGQDAYQPISSITGPDLLEYAVHECNGLSRDTLQAMGLVALPKDYIYAGSPTFFGFNSTGRFRICYPINFVLPQLGDPLAEAFLLPVTRYPTDPILTLTFSTQGEIDIHGVPTFEAEDITVRIHVRRRQVTDINWQFIKQDFSAWEYDITQDADNRRDEMLTPGSYFGMLSKQFLKMAAGDYSGHYIRHCLAKENNPQFSIKSLTDVLRQFTWPSVRDRNDRTRPGIVLPPYTADGGIAVSTPVAGTAGGDAVIFVPPSPLPGTVTYSAGDSMPLWPASYFHDFLTDGYGDAMELGSVLDANIPANSGAKLWLIGNYGLNGQTAGKMRQLIRRAYGNLNSAKGPNLITR